MLGKISLDDIDIHSIGNEIQMEAVLWGGNGQYFLTLVPQKNLDIDPSEIKLMPLTLEEWEKFLRQTDLLETEILSQDSTGSIVKAIYRKSQRQIDNYLQWACFKDANYHCEYCYRDGIPLTIDHCDLWENGGVTSKENLISVCRNCNKERGRIEYDVWINSNLYKKRSINLPEEIKQKNIDRIQQLPHLKTLRVTHVRSR